MIREREVDRANWQEHRILEYPKTIYVPVWDAATQERLYSFWNERGFRFQPAKGDEQIGRRGSLLGNMTSFDMSKLMATLTIIRMGDEITFVMEIDAYMQVITPWEEAYWKLELERAASYILYGDKREHEWRAFRKRLLPAQLRSMCRMVLPRFVKAPIQPPIDRDGRFVSFSDI